MAKLSVVVPSNEVEVGGVRYRKVERKAQAGDIVKAQHYGTDITKGSFYAVTTADGGVGFYDNVNDFRSPFTLGEPRYEVYEKVTEPAVPEYREVNREAEKGERIRIVSACDSRYSNGDEFVVEKSGTDGGGVYVRHPNGTHDGCAGILRREYVVLEPVNIPEPAPQPERLKVGDYVKVTDASGSGHAKKGDIAVVTNDNWLDNHGKLLDVKTLDGRTYGMFSHRFVRATESEVEAAKKDAERTKKIGEFADGGYAEIVNANYDNASSSARDNNGLYVKVEAKLSPWGTRQLTLTLPDGKCGGYCNADALRKVTREEYEEATKPKPVFNVGDTVKIVSGAGERFLTGYDIGDICEVVDGPDRDGDYTLKALRKKVINGNAQTEQLEKVSVEEVARIEEEAKWAAIGRKVGEYKAGDVVRVIKSCSIADTKVGDVTTIEQVSDYRGVFLTQLNSGGSNAFIYSEEVELITPVEQRFDRAKSPQAEGGASTSK